MRFRGDADAGVDHVEAEVVAIGLRFARSAKLDLAVLGELGRVREKVEQALAELEAIGVRRAKRCETLHADGVAVGLGLGRDRGDRFFDQRVDVDVLHACHHATGFDLGKIEHVVDQRQQAMRRAVECE